MLMHLSLHHNSRDLQTNCPPQMALEIIHTYLQIFMDNHSMTIQVFI